MGGAFPGWSGKCRRGAAEFEGGCLITGTAHQAVEEAARHSYGRLVAFLAARCRNLAAAEDALGDALRMALESWPTDGIPQQPEAWLLTVARRRLIDRDRRRQVEAAALPDLSLAFEAAVEMSETDLLFPDERLKLLFVLAHPAIDEAARAPLMLQTVLGLDAARIASAFLVQPAAMGQRLSRAKTKIRDAGIAFELPEATDLEPRLTAVLDAIYAAYGSGWDDLAGADLKRRGLAREALFLGALLARLMPREPEALGLLALMLHCEARRGARRDGDGRYVPLLAQETALWDVEMIAAAEHHLDQAARLNRTGLNRTGRYQLEAAIQSAHAQRAQSGVTDWEAVALLYEGLVRIAPSIGALVGRAAAVAEARGAATGIDLLQALPQERVESYQPYWAVAAHLLAKLARNADAAAAYDKAIGLSDDPAQRQFLIDQARSLPRP